MSSMSPFPQQKGKLCIFGVEYFRLNAEVLPGSPEYHCDLCAVPTAEFEGVIRAKFRSVGLHLCETKYFWRSFQEWSELALALFTLNFQQSLCMYFFFLLHKDSVNFVYDLIK